MGKCKLCPKAYLRDEDGNLVSRTERFCAMCYRGRGRKEVKRSS